MITTKWKNEHQRGKAKGVPGGGSRRAVSEAIRTPSSPEARTDIHLSVTDIYAVQIDGVRGV